MSRRIMKWKDGDYNRVCDKSGLTYKRSELIREELTGMLVHSRWADPAHPFEKPWQVIIEGRNLIEARRDNNASTVETFNIITNDGDSLVTDTGDNLVFQ